MKKRAEYIEEFYKNHYKKLIENGSGGFAHKLMHLQLEKGASSSYFSKTLELGAGSGEHLRYVEHKFDQYIQTDITVPEQTYVQKDGTSFKSMDAEKIDFPDSSLDRIVVSCLLHHLNDPLACLSEMRRVLKPSGKADLLLPCDPGLVFRFLRMIGTRRAAKKLGILREKIVIDALDYRNHFGALKTQIDEVFNQDSVEYNYFPTKIPSWNINAWVIVRIQKAKN